MNKKAHTVWAQIEKNQWMKGIRELQSNKNSKKRKTIDEQMLGQF